MCRCVMLLMSGVRKGPKALKQKDDFMDNGTGFVILEAEARLLRFSSKLYACLQNVRRFLPVPFFRV